MDDDLRRGMDLLGLAVFAVKEGKRLGEIVSLLVRRETSTVSVVGLRGPGGLYLLPFDRLRVIGPDGVMLDSEAVLAEALHSDAVADLESDLVGRPVLTTGGRKVGEVVGFRIHTGDGRIEAYRVRPNEGMAARLASLMTGERLEIPVSHVIALGPDSLIVREDVDEDPAESPPPLPTA